MADKYTQADRDEMAKSGEAMPDGSYPIKDEDDLDSALVLAKSGHGTDMVAVRKHIMKRAKALGLSSKIPDNWNSDGSVADEDKKSGPASIEWRKAKAAEMRSSERRTERRTFHLEGAEVRENPDGTLHLSGYASVTETPYDMGWYTESIGRGAFKKTLAEDPDVQLLINHAGLPLARTKSGTLQLSEDNTGLRVDADLDPEDPDVQSLARKMKRGDIDQMSFAFRPNRQEWNADYTDRRITECDIHRGDVSVVNQGANPATSTSIRSWDGLLAVAMELRGHEDLTPEMRRSIAEALGMLPDKERIAGMVNQLDEMRAGKTISKDTGDKIQSAIDTLNGLLGNGGDGVDDDPGDDDAPSPDADPSEGDEHLSLPPYDMRAERARLEAQRYRRAA